MHQVKKKATTESVQLEPFSFAIKKLLERSSKDTLLYNNV